MVSTGLALHWLTMGYPGTAFMIATSNDANNDSGKDGGEIEPPFPFVDSSRRMPPLRLIWLGGLVQLGMMGAYLAGNRRMGNRTVKSYSMLWNMILTLALLLGVSSSSILPYFPNDAESVKVRVAIIHALWVEWLVYWIPNVCYWMWTIYVPSMNEIIPNKLYLGNASGATSAKLIQKYGITHILELHGGNLNRANNVYKVPYHVRLQQLECHDSVDNNLNTISVSDAAITFMDGATSGKSNAKVLVHCSGTGVSTSPAMVCHYLVHSKQQPNVQAAYQHVKRARPLVDVSPDHMRALQEYQSSGGGGGTTDKGPAETTTKHSIKKNK
jgi:hypothetical protein